MGGSRCTVEDIRCALLWRLARNHGWASWTTEEALIRAVPSHERGRARDIAGGLRDGPVVIHHPDRGFKTAHEHIELLARGLYDTCGFSHFRIEATLSHFGGFE